MAIKINGTTVIDDSRNLSNVGGLKTVNGNSLIGSGNISAGASTTYGAVGTYTYGRPANQTQYLEGATVSNLVSVGPNAGSVAYRSQYGNWSGHNRLVSVSGTWRAMQPITGGSYGGLGIWVRIS